MIIINCFLLILCPEFTMFWAIFITSFLTFNTCGDKRLKPSTVNSQPSTVNSQPSTVNRQPSTTNSQPSTVNS
ncbi:hypothetical protein [Umezakia ovalisporum]|uniref:hypothetical protein n=1 Tax=Umezakia ovalisporum TaxID=75695 RepID=UPI00247575F2|nr:hypothetical protein [Umezakia ovalisporum]MDH6087221.1 hypothetical protein [Umezakia ovalisporum Ak1311]